MSSYAIRLFSAFLVASSLVLGGCVSPGSVGSSDLARYQQATAKRGSAQRLGKEGLNSLRPKNNSALPKFEITRDEQTSRTIIRLKLNEAVMHALASNLDIRVVSFDPAMSREDVIEAAAAFDHVIFGSAGYNRVDVRTQTPLASGQFKESLFEAGIKQRFVTGADWSLTWALSRAWDNSTFSTLRTRYEPTLIFEISQPLLRDAGTELNLAELHVAQIDYQISMASFRQEVEAVATEVINTYWDLVQARRDREIAENLLNLTLETLQRVLGRRELDATAVQIKQTEQAVETRRAILIQSRKNVQDVQDRLARLLADPQINLLSEYEIVPASVPDTGLVQISTDKELAVALKNNPLLEQGRLSIEAADINVDVAKNQILPDLSFTGSAGVQGLDDTLGKSHQWLWDGNYFNWSIGLLLEYPLGNRQRQAQLRRSKFERLKSITALQNSADQVALLVKERIRQIDNAYQQWQAQKSAVEAAKIQLQALEDTERIRGQLTPEFLLVKLDAQAALALAEQAELKAIVNYNVAFVDLAQATGTVLELFPLQASASSRKEKPAATTTPSQTSPEQEIQTIEVR